MQIHGFPSLFSYNNVIATNIFVNPLLSWTFPKISYCFLQDDELKRNWRNDKVETDFLRDKA